MPNFSYRAVDAVGHKRSGFCEKDDEQAALEYLKACGLFPVKIRKAHTMEMELSELRWLKPLAALKDTATLCRRLSFFLTSGVELPHAFQMLISGSEIAQKKPKLARKLERINEKLQKGENLSEALTGDDYFPNLMSLMCRVGETGGALPQAMGTLADYFETESKNRQSLLGVMIYPIVTTIMMVGVILLTVLYVLPGYASIFEAESLVLPLPTRMLMAVSEFLPRYPWQTAGVLIGLILAVCAFCCSDRGRVAIGCLKLKMPGLRTIARKRMNLRFCRSLAILLAAGEPLAQSVEMAGQTLGNAFLTSAVLSVCAALEAGRPLWVALFGFEYFDPLLVSMIQVGEETGRLAETLQKCAVYLQNETERDAAILNRLAEPAVTLALGLVLAFVMLSVILPTFALTGAM